MASKAKTKAPAKRGRGRPPFEPTDEQRYGVQLMASIGIPQADIAAALEISQDTLRKHFRTELDTGRTRIVTQVAGSLVSQALAGNVSAAIFYLKTQGRWRETPTEIEHSGSIGVVGIEVVPPRDS